MIKKLLLSCPFLLAFGNALATPLVSIAKPIDMRWNAHFGGMFETESEARAEQESYLARIKEEELVKCAEEFQVPRERIFSRFDYCKTSRDVELFGEQPARWFPQAWCEKAFCGVEPMDNAFTSKFRGINWGASFAVPRNQQIIEIDLDAVARRVNEIDVIAVIPHFFIRTNDGPFHEVQGLARSPNQPGWHSRWLFTGFEKPLAIIVNPPVGSDRIEFYVQFERWKFTSQTRETGMHYQLIERVSDGYVSNFGKNFRIDLKP